MAIVYNRGTDWISHKRKTLVTSKEFPSSTPTEATINTNDNAVKNPKLYHNNLKILNMMIHI
jgi:hypothetical protein